MCAFRRGPSVLPSEGHFEGEQDLPSNLLDDVADEGGALAQVTLGAGDAGLDDAGGGFLQFWNRPTISFKVHHPRLPRERRAAQRSSTR